MIKILKRINNWFRDIVLDDVDKEYEKPLPYHKGFGDKKAQIERIKQKRETEQNQMSRGL